MTINEWLPTIESYKGMLAALATGNTETFSKLFKECIMETLGFKDV